MSQGGTAAAHRASRQEDASGVGHKSRGRWGEWGLGAVALGGRWRGYLQWQRLQRKHCYTHSVGHLTPQRLAVGQAIVQAVCATWSHLLYRTYLPVPPPSLNLPDHDHDHT